VKEGGVRVENKIAGGVAHVVVGLTEVTKWGFPPMGGETHDQKNGIIKWDTRGGVAGKARRHWGPLKHAVGAQTKKTKGDLRGW